MIDSINKAFSFLKPFMFFGDKDELVHCDGVYNGEWEVSWFYFLVACQNGPTMPTQIKKMIESLNGSIDIETEPGLGSRFILKIPVTLAIIQALLVVIKNQVFAFPLENVSEVIKIGPQDIYSVDGAPMIKLRGHALSLLSMAGILGVSEEEGKNEGECKAVIVNGNGELAAIKADSLIGEDEIVVKACPDYFAGVKGISGASILGDGNIALIMDVSAILREV